MSDDLLIKYKNIPSNHIFIIENKELLNDELINELINYINTTNNFSIEKWDVNKNVNCKYVTK